VLVNAMCGVIAISGTPNSAYEVFFGLMNLQHRGQDGAGILTLDRRKNEGFYLQRGSGLIENIFAEGMFKHTVGYSALGHSRYATIGHNDPNLLQPFLDFQSGIGLAHNGNIVNYYDLKADLAKQGEHLTVESDSALILQLLSSQLRDKEINAENVFAAIKHCTQLLVGSYSVICLAKNGDVFGFRDPHGIRPLVLGKRNNGETVYVLASETVAAHFLGYESLEDVLPGEAVYISREKGLQRRIIKQQSYSPCMFEWVYFARVESEFSKKTVYEGRFQLGVILGEQLKKDGIEADVVVPVPETSRVSAVALAEVMGVPFRELLIKNRYINRTFILDDQASRQEAIRRKLFPVAAEMKGKRVLIVDDSIVRGNTAQQLVKLVRQSGAKEVTLVSTCPPIVNPCYYGIDFPSKGELIAHGKSPEEIAELLGADRVVYQTLEGLLKAIGEPNLCLGCLTGRYPTDVTSGQDFETMRLKDRALSAKVKGC
jgi:amidophosphoribosyltransferase